MLDIKISKKFLAFLDAKQKEVEQVYEEAFMDRMIHGIGAFELNSEGIKHIPYAEICERLEAFDSTGDGPVGK